MISFEFLRVYSIGWIVSRGKHFVHMTRPGARDWPAACFSRPIDVYYDTTSQQVVDKILPELWSENYSSKLKSNIRYNKKRLAKEKMKEMRRGHITYPTLSR